MPVGIVYCETGTTTAEKRGEPGGVTASGIPTARPSMEIIEFRQGNR